MEFGYGVTKAGGELRQFLGTRIHCRGQAIRGECRQGAVSCPMLENTGIFKKFGKKDFMIALEARHAMGSGAFDQQIQNGRGILPTVDIVAEEDVNRFGNWVFFEILIDPRKQLFEQIRPTVDIAHRVNA